MENLNYVLDGVTFSGSFYDLIYITLLYMLWFIASVLILFASDGCIKVSLIGVILIPLVTYLLFPRLTELALGKSTYYLLADFVLFKMVLFILNKKIPSNEIINLSRFQLNPEQIADFQIIISGLKKIKDELNELNSLDIDRRADGGYSERSRKGKEANARIKELESARSALKIKEAEYMERQNKFSSIRFTKNIFDKTILNSIILSIVFTVVILFFVSKEFAVFYGYINLSLFIVLSLILFFFLFGKLEKQEESLHDMVYEYYKNGQKTA